MPLRFIFIYSYMMTLVLDINFARISNLGHLGAIRFKYEYLLTAADSPCILHTACMYIYV